MAINTLDKNIVANIKRYFLPEFENSTVTLNTVNRSIINKRDFNPRSGNTCEVKRPQKYNTIRTARGDLTSESASTINSATATGYVQDYITWYLEWEAYEEALELDQMDQLMKPGPEQIITDLEVDLNKFIKNKGAHFLGTAGTDVDAWSDISELDSFAKAMGWPSGMIYAQVDPYAIRDLADVQRASFKQDYVSSAWERSQITNMVGNIRLFMSNALAQHDVGTWDAGLTLNATPTQTYDSGKNTYQTTMVLTGADTSVTDFLKKGDTIKIASKYWNQMKTRQQASKQGAGLAYTGTVDANVDSTAGGLVTVVVNGPAFYETGSPFNTISAPLASGDAVTVVSGTSAGSNVPNLFYHADAFGCAQVEQTSLPSLENAVMNNAKTGMSMRVVKFADGVKNTAKVRFDLQPVYVAYDQLLGGKFFGS